MRLTISHKLTATLVFFISLGAGIFFFVIIPSVRSIESTAQFFATNAQKESAEFEKLRLLRRSFGEKDIINDSLDAISYISISRQEESNLIQTLEALATEYNITQDLSVSFAPGQDAQTPGKYTFSFSSTGTFENIHTYFAKLESLPYYLTIPKITIQKTNSPNNQFVTLSFTATLLSSL